MAPANIFSANHFKPAKDLGLHLKRLGFADFESLIFPNVPIAHIGQLNPDMFTISGGIKVDDDRYVVTFDFGNEVFQQLIGKIPMKQLKSYLKEMKITDKP